MQKNNEEKSFPKVRLSWYPGHMAKTKRQIMEDMKLIDVVIELLDARIPISSRNPDIKNLTKNKKKIIILNKIDLADSNASKKWQEYFSKEAVTLLTDSNSGTGVDKVSRKIEEMMKEVKEKEAQKGRINKTTRVMILGIPNVGKSSFINRISKKKSMEVANYPGVTREKKWIRIGKSQELLDTPGVLWPKFESEEVSLNLAFTGTIKDDILHLTDICYELLKVLMTNYKSNLMERYKITEDEWNQVISMNNKTYELMKLIARKRGAIVSGGKTDDEKVSRIILEEFRSGKIGKITLELPKD
ncbi:MAG: ribosome biogenesis GTPase YlqF [Clostridia bacterium]|nr:ribosome biogenesis GTPase YlqF [Clostridia bacterium]